MLEEKIKIIEELMDESLAARDYKRTEELLSLYKYLIALKS